MFSLVSGVFVQQAHGWATALSNGRPAEPQVFVIYTFMDRVCQPSFRKSGKGNLERFWELLNGWNHYWWKGEGKPFWAHSGVCGVDRILGSWVLLHGRKAGCSISCSIRWEGYVASGKL